jgi:hypothetical protein
MNRNEMDVNRQVPSSRRRAIGAGLLGTTTATASPLPPVANPTLATTVVNYPDLIEHARASVAAYRQAADAERIANDALEAILGRETLLQVMKYVDGPFMDAREAWEDLVLAEIARHLPMIAPVLGLVWDHILETGATEHGRCCVDEVDGRV